MYAHSSETWPDFRSRDGTRSELADTTALLGALQAFYALFPSITAACAVEIELISELRGSATLPPSVEAEIVRRDSGEWKTPGLEYWRYMTALVLERRRNGNSARVGAV